MKLLLRTSFLMGFFFLMANPLLAQVKTDYDKSFDFTQIQSYKLEGWEQNSDQILTSFDKERIENALKDELGKRGIMQKDEDPDGAVTLYIVVDSKTSTTAYTTYTGGMGYGYGRWGWGMGTGMGTSTTSFSEDDYLEGTFVVSMHDVASKELVWQGVITAVVKEKPEKREKTVPKKMKKLFKDYPVKPVK